MARRTAPIIALILGAAGTALAATPSARAEATSLDSPDRAALYRGAVSANAVLDDFAAEDRVGAVLGDVANIIAGTDGRLLSVVAEVGGFLDIADTHVSVPWREVELLGEGRLALSLRADALRAHEYTDAERLTADAAAAGVVPGVGALATGPDAFRLATLIGGDARLTGEDGAGTADAFGYVSDALLKDGEIVAVVVNPSSGFGPRGYRVFPFDAADYAPQERRLDLPYARGEAMAAPTFEFGLVRTL